MGRQRGEDTFLHHRGLPGACFIKLPSTLYPPASNFKTRKLRQGRHQSREKLLHLQQVLPPTLLPVLKSPSSPPRGRQKRPPPPSTAASRVQPTCRVSTLGQGPPQGDAPTVRSSEVQTTLTPVRRTLQPPRAREGSREGGGAGERRKERWGGRAWRAAPRGHDPGVLPSPRAAVATDRCRKDLQSALHAGSQRLSRSGTPVSR